MANKFAIVDLSNLINRSRYAITGDSYSKTGMALQIMFRSLRKIYRDHKVDHVVFAVDYGSWRYEVYPQYKARRKADRLSSNTQKQEENHIFYELTKDLVIYLKTKTRCTVLEHPNVEADDFVARWIQLHPDDEHIIVSGDSDFVQLLAPNVKLYDGIQDHLMSIDGIKNSKGETLEFTVKYQDGKIKSGVVNPNFTPEDEWWKKSLFIKIIRGDASDGIFSAYPGVRSKGSKKHEGIEDAWNDRHDKGYHWNNFFQQTWDKLIIEESLTKRVKVIDEYNFNSSLIDLTKQPDNIKSIMDRYIAALDSKDVKGVGIFFIKFCGDHDLPALVNESADHAVYLNSGLQRGLNNELGSC